MGKTSCSPQALGEVPLLFSASWAAAGSLALAASLLSLPPSTHGFSSVSFRLCFLEGTYHWTWDSYRMPSTLSSWNLLLNYIVKEPTPKLGHTHRFQEWDVNVFWGEHPLNPLQAAWFFGTVYAGIWDDSRAYPWGLPWTLQWVPWNWGLQFTEVGPIKGREREILGNNFQTDPDKGPRTTHSGPAETEACSKTGAF